MITFETIILIVNCFVLHSARLGTQIDSNAKDSIGNIIIYFSLALSLVALLFIAIKIGLGIRASCKLAKLSKEITGKNTRWLNVLAVPFQTGGMGFDVAIYSLKAQLAMREKIGTELQESSRMPRKLAKIVNESKNDLANSGEPLSSKRELKRSAF